MLLYELIKVSTYRVNSSFLFFEQLNLESRIIKDTHNPEVLYRWLLNVAQYDCRKLKRSFLKYYHTTLSSHLFLYLYYSSTDVSSFQRFYCMLKLLPAEIEFFSFTTGQYWHGRMNVWCPSAASFNMTNLKYCQCVLWSSNETSNVWF